MPLVNLGRALAPLAIAWSVLTVTEVEAGDSPDGDARDRNTWAIGIGAGVVSFPDYVGSDERRVWPLPLPFLRYDSRHLKVERGGLSGVLDLTDRTHLTLSFGGSLPVSSSDNEAREDMDDLSPIGEIGPSLIYDIVREPDGANRLTLEFAIRSAIAVDLIDVQQVGWIATPLIEYQRQQPLADGQLKFSANTGPIFNSERYNSYFYRVSDRDERPDRPTYDADAGYGGWRLSGSASWRWHDFWFGVFARYINLNGAKFENSPLTRTSHYLMGGVGFAWIFATSSDEENL